ncbi:hypothetical protein [Fodinicurvata halophila]
MTRTLRAGGLGLSQASQATGQLLEGADVRIHLSQFSSFEDARKTLCRVGVEQVTQA